MAADPTIAARRELAAAIGARTEADAAVRNVTRAIGAAAEERTDLFTRRAALEAEHAKQQRVQGGPAGADADARIAAASGAARVPAAVMDRRDFAAEIQAVTDEIDRLDAAAGVMRSREADATFRLSVANGKVHEAVRAVIAHSPAVPNAIADFHAAVERVLTASAVLTALARVDPGRCNAVLARAPIKPSGSRHAPWDDFERAKAPASDWLAALEALDRDAAAPLPGERAVKL